MSYPRLPLLVLRAREPWGFFPPASLGCADVAVEGPSERDSIPLAQVDLIRLAVKTERDRLRSRRPIEIIDLRLNHLSCHDSPRHQFGRPPPRPNSDRRRGPSATGVRPRRRVLIRSE